MQLKPVLFKDQLYMLCDLVKKKSQLKPPRLMVFQLGQPYLSSLPELGKEYTGSNSFRGSIFISSPSYCTFS